MAITLLTRVTPERVGIMKRGSMEVAVITITITIMRVTAIINSGSENSFHDKVNDNHSYKDNDDRNACEIAIPMARRAERMIRVAAP